MAARVQALEPRVLLTAVPVGSEFQVNSYTTGNQRTFVEAPQAVARDADGDFVVTWTSYGQDGAASNGVFAQRYNAAGVAQGAEFQVNTFTTDNQLNATVAMDADGDFVITWTSYSQDGDSSGIYAQRYNAAGVAQGSEFRVNTYTTSFQRFSTVAMDADGDFVVTWSSGDQDGNSEGVFAQRYNAAGVAQGTEFQVNTYTTNSQKVSTVAMDADGDFVITWSSLNQTGDDSYGIFAQRYNAAGVAQGSEFHVNTYTTGNQRLSTIAMDADGDFVVLWSSQQNQDGNSFGVFGQRFNAAGVAQGTEFQVNTYTTGSQDSAAVAMDADGDFVVVWEGPGQGDTGNGVFAQQYNAAGVAQGTEFLVNTYTTDNQRVPSVAMDADGDFVVVWSSSAQDAGTYGIYAQRFTVNNQLPVINNQNFNVAENRPVGQVVGTVVATDPDAMQTLSFAITAGNTGNVFAINSATGQITVASATINFEALNQYNLTVQVTDSGAPNALSDTATVTINVTDLNEAPTFLAPTTFSIAENRSVGFVVGDVNTVDPEGNTVTYSIVGGDPNAQFAINPSTGVITVAKATINFEATPQFLLSVKAQDNGSPANSRTQTITVNVTDLNEPPVFLAPTTFTIAENRSVGFVVGDVNTVDPEGNTVTYSIVGGDPNAQFAINPTTGVITVAKATIDFEITPQFLLSVKAQDNGSPANSKTQTITVNVTNINEAPVFLAPTTFTIAENRSVGFVVGDVNTVDPEGNTVTFSIVGGDPNAQFAINPTTGVITVAKATINFETTPQFLLSVKAQDNGSPANSRTQTITVNVTNINEAPSFLAPTTFTIQENRPNGTVVGTVNTVDPEGNAVAYSITAGNTNNAFAINAGTGQITVNNQAALDFETTPQFLLSVKALDNGSPANSKTQTITINLTNIVGQSLTPAASESRLATSAGSSGQQIVTTVAAAVPPLKRTPPASEPGLYSFTLFEPLAAVSVSEDDA